LTADSAGDITAIAAWLAAYSGISTTIIGIPSLMRAVQQRLKATGVTDLATYHDLLLESPEEQQDLVELVVVPETWFFRDRHPYAYLREHVAGLLQAGLPSQPLRLLSAPCSTGEEPYSMAMTLLDMGVPSQAFSIDAVDICRRSIRKARLAVYGKHSFRGVSEEEQRRHFQATAKGQALHPAIRQPVHFRRSNLMNAQTELGSQYDVIFCRNLLIYLEEDASQQLLTSLAGLLKVGGLLIVGSAESGKVPSSLYSPIRTPFVFGFLKREPQALPVPAAAATSNMDQNAAPRRASVSRPARRTHSGRTSRFSSLPLASMATPAPAPGPASAQDAQRFARELERDPTSPSTYLRFGQWLREQNRAEEAIDCFQKCLYLKPDSRDALLAMIQLTTQLGQLERSRHFQGRLERLNP
jgi:chemotaxis protein methyltransferase WspC